LLLLLILPTWGQTQDAPATPPVEVDHVFIFVERKAPEAIILEQFGLKRTSHPTRHVGAGTASISFLFENAYLELLWVEDEEEVKTQERTWALRADWRRTGASPFGLGLRRVNPAIPTLPFPTVSHSAAWMRPGTEMAVATSSSDPMEPTIFVVPSYMALPAWLTPKYYEIVKVIRAQLIFKPLTRHPVGIRALTGIKMLSPSKQSQSATMGVLEQIGLVTFEYGPEYLLELTFDDGQRGKALDVRPTLPLILRY
jgi:hypothetical protein